MNYKFEDMLQKASTYLSLLTDCEYDVYFLFNLILSQCQ